ncbi:MAG: NusG domain II-containing protein [Lachnospiraceae bacterium]|nr:NusG domain II-containing protein [Lachnospiraceae bacterium]
MKKEQNEIYANNVKKYDVLLVIIIFVIAMLTAVAIHFIKDNHGDSQKLVVVTLNNKEYGKYPLSEDRVFDIFDDNYCNTIVIADNQVFMKEADCPDKYCVKTGAIKNINESIICLPNRIVVEICTDTGEDELEGTEAADAGEDELDANVDAISR